MTNRQLDILVWTLIYAGLAGFVLGWVLWDAARPLAWALLVGGAPVAAAGVLLLWVRARRTGPDRGVE